MLVCEEGGVKNPPPPGNDVATLWSEALGVPLSCLGLVDDSLTTNMDGTSLFVFEGKARKEKKGQFVIAPPDIAEKGKSCSTFKRGTHTPFDGVQAELMITTAADGTVAPLVVKFKGLTPDEVTGALFVEVPGLGYSRNNNSTGTVMFVGSSSGEDPDSTPAVLSSQYYHSKILLPWIRGKRQELGWHDGTPVPPHLAAVASCDGAQDMLKAIIKCLTCDEADLVHNIKIAAAMTGTAQPNDVALCFKLIKLYAKSMEASDTTSSSRFKERLKKQFKELHGLKLPTKKLNAIVDFLAVLPDVLQKAITAKYITDSYRDTGWIGKGKGPNSWPTIEGFYQQVRRKVSKEEKELVRRSLPKLAEHYHAHGHVPDSVFSELGFDPDKHLSTGEDVHRSSDADHLQRGKSIGHPYQRQKRMDVVNRQKEKEANQLLRDKQKRKVLLDESSLCERAAQEAAALRLCDAPKGKDLVKKKVLMYWPSEEERWCTATVTGYETTGRNKGKHVIEYDGDADEDGMLNRRP